MSLILKPITPELHRSLTCTITPQFHNYMKYMDGVLDDQFMHHIHSNPNEYIQKRYGADRKLRILIFFKKISDKGVCKVLRKSFPGIKLVLFTNDIHGNEALHEHVNDCDWLIAMTSAYQFKRLRDLDVREKLIHSGNRCPDEFIQAEPNFSSRDAIFFYGAKYNIRKEFLKHASKNWKVIKYNRPPRGGFENEHLSVETARQLYKCTYAFATGNDFTNSAVKCDAYYLVAKFFEIMGSGCLLLCDHHGVQKELNSLGFVEGQHYLHINKHISAQVRKFVESHPDKVKEMRIRAHQLVTSKYTIKKACEDINAKFRSILQK